MTQPPTEDTIAPGDARRREPAAEPFSVLWFSTLDGSTQSRNISWEAFTGQRHNEYAGWGWLDAVHPDDRASVRQGWRDAVESRRIVELNYRLMRHDGAYRDVTIQAAPVPDDGSVSEWVGICIDNTLKRQAEAALRETAQAFEFLDRLAQATRPVTDAEGIMSITTRMLGEHLTTSRCAYADVEADNNSFTIRRDWTASGYGSSEGVYSLELFGPRATQNMRRGERLVLRDVDRELGDESGARMFNAIGVKAIICAGLVKEGRLVAMMAVHQSEPRNWTERDINLVEEVVQRCWAHIERVRDHAILREHDRRKDEFIATLAHELRNPLAPLKYAVAMLRKSPGPGEAPRHAPAQAHDVIDRQVSLMARLIDDLLDLSRINRGTIELKTSRVELGELMLQAVETARPLVVAAGHRLSTTRADTPLWLDGDAQRIIQAIGNLLTNAAKYTPEGGEIRVSVQRSGRRALLEVADTGIGIPADQQGRLFQMFTQLEHTAKRTQGGLGIGLALVKTLVTMHGGEVQVFSQGLGQGSTFRLDFPLSASTPEDVAFESADSPSPATAGMRVLVVEDNKDGLDTLVALLELMDYTVAGAEDGFKALDIARSFQPEVVLLDLGLPGMDGLDVARAMRADNQMKNAYIVALTGWGTERDRQRTAEAGFDAHLTKPVEPSVLESYLVGYSAKPRQGTART